MIQPIRPQDASGIYQRQVSSSREAGEAPAQRTGAAGRGDQPRRTDHVAVSDEARLFARIMQSVVDAPDIRATRVAELRQRVESGTYQVDADALARLMFERGVQG